MDKRFLLLMSLILIIMVMVLINNSLKQEEGNMKDTNLVSQNKFIDSDVYTPPNAIVFDNENKEVGRLEFTKDGMKFTGNADESAKIFFDLFLKGYVDEFIKDLLKKEDLNK